jgi:23S rRNA (uracil1939-C5)-methyltransferase
MLKKNTLHQTIITDLNNLGYGIARVEGVVVFVDGGVTGDEVLIKLIKIARDYAVARIEKIISPSPHRMPTDCGAFPRCGGCTFRHITREYELTLKKELVESAFRKHRVEAEVNEVVTDGKLLGYRNKVQYPVGENGVIGYYASHSHTIVPCENCLLTDSALTPVAKFASAYIRDSGAKVKHIYLRRGAATGDTQLCFVSPERSLPDEEGLVKAAREAFPALKNVLLNYHPEETNVILGKEVRCLYGEDRIEDILCDCRFGISSLSFYQVNRGAAELLYREAIRRGAEAEPKKVADLYCGAGTIGISFAKAHPGIAVTGVEIVDAAVENAGRNAAMNGVENASFLCADAMTADLDGVDCILVDPPRKGLSRELTERLCDLSPKKLVYVSCDPTTLARDAALLIAAGYKMGTVTPVDMFPRTGSVECVTDFVK